MSQISVNTINPNHDSKLSNCFTIFTSCIFLINSVDQIHNSCPFCPTKLIQDQV